MTVVDQRSRPARALERRLEDAGVDASKGVALASRKPDWVRAELRIGPELVRLRSTMRELDLVTVARRPAADIFECWDDGTRPS